MWWRFRKHKLAVASGRRRRRLLRWSCSAPISSPTPTRNASEAQRSLMPPQRIHWFDGWRLQPARLRAVKGARDPQTFKRVYRPDPEPEDPGPLLRPGLRVQASSA